MDGQQKPVDGWLKLGFTKREAELADALLDAMAAVLARMKGDLEARIATLEENKGLAYRGVHTEGELYESGDYVTRSGSLWCALKRTRGRPGQDAAAWQLCVKKGRGG